MPWEIVPPGTKIDFIGKRRLAALLSGLLLLTSVVAVWVNGVQLGIDFAGGTEVQLEFAQGVPASDGAIRDVLTEALEIAELLRGWNGIARADSPAAAAYHVFLEALTTDLLERELGESLASIERYDVDLRGW